MNDTPTVTIEVFPSVDGSSKGVIGSQLTDAEPGAYELCPVGGSLADADIPKERIQRAMKELAVMSKLGGMPAPKRPSLADDPAAELARIQFCTTHTAEAVWFPFAKAWACENDRNCTVVDAVVLRAAETEGD